MVGCIIGALQELFVESLPQYYQLRPKLDELVESAAWLWQERSGRDPEPEQRTQLRHLLSSVLAVAGLTGRDHQLLWFMPQDLHRAETLVRARISRALLEELNRNRKLRYCRVTYRTLALVLCTVGKNCHTSHGFVPTKSIRGMLKWHRINTHGCHVKVLLCALMDAGLVKCINDFYEWGGCCRQYAISAVVYSIPFLASLKPLEVECHVAGAPARRPATAPTTREQSESGTTAGTTLLINILGSRPRSKSRCERLIQTFTHPLMGLTA
jgi:hypothetical protein